MIKSVHYLLLILAIIICAGISRAELYAYEGFDYTEGTDVAGLNGGSGWSGSWTVPTPQDTQNITSVGLAYEDEGTAIATEGKALNIVCTADGSAVVSRDMATQVGQDDTTVWFAYLYKANSLGNGHNFVKLNGNQATAIGRRWAGSFAIDNTGSGIMPVVGDTYLLVARYDCKSGDDDVYLWVNPSVTEEPTLGSANATLSKDLGVGGSVVFDIQGYGNNNIEFDEVRVGHSYTDVVPTDVPGGVQASDGDFEDKVQVTWNTVEGASSYTVYRAITNDSSQASSLQSGITTNVYDDTTATPLQIYWYWVKSDLSSVFSGSDSGYRAQSGIPQPPENVSASDDTYADKVVVTWTASSNATKYTVYRNIADNFSTATDLSGEIVATTYDDTTVVPGQVYFYWVTAGNDGGWSFESDSDTGYASYDSIAYEGFDYTAGESINGKTGGLGWEGAWLAAEDTIQTVQAEGLEYPGLQTSGGSLLMEAHFADSKSAKATRDTLKTFGAATQDIWYSFLFKPVVLSDGHAFFIPNGTWDCGAGKAWGNTLSMHNWGSDIQGQNGETYLMVVRCINGGSYLWIDPSLKDEPPAGSADVSQDSTTLSENNKVFMEVQHYQATNSFVFDEIRVGYSWDQVTPDYVVKNIQASDGEYTDKVAVTWDARSDALGYTVYRNTTDDGSSATAISSELAVTSYDDTTATPGTIYYYWVKARFESGADVIGYSDSGYRKDAAGPDKPQNVSASDGVVGQTYVQVDWDVVSGAGIMYKVFRNSVDEYAGAEAVSSDISANQYLDASAVPGIVYYYWVRAKNAAGWGNFSDSDTGFIPALQVAYYAMDELDGTNMVDSSANGFDGVYRDSPTLGVNSADPVQFNTAVKFDVSDAVINSNSPICDLTNNFTVAMWLKPDEIGEEEYRWLFSSQGPGGWGVAVFTRSIVFDVPGVSSMWSPVDSITVGQWTHVAVTYSHLNIVKMYVNGALSIDERPFGAAAQYDKSNLLVANNASDDLFIGAIDEINVYSGILSDTEILELAGIPEPGSIVLVAGLAGLLLLRRKNR
jgi:hypothetical protein